MHKNQSNQHFGTRAIPSNLKVAIHVTTNTEPNHIHDYEVTIRCRTPLEKKSDGR